MTNVSCFRIDGGDKIKYRNSHNLSQDKYTHINHYTYHIWKISKPYFNCMNKITLVVAKGVVAVPVAVKDLLQNAKVARAH